MNTESAPKGAPEAATAKRQAQSYLTTADRLAEQLRLFENLPTSGGIGRVRRAGEHVSAGQSKETVLDRARARPRFLSGKVRPGPREPGVTHYGCMDACCRSWSA